MVSELEEDHAVEEISTVGSECCCEEHAVLALLIIAHCVQTHEFFYFDRFRLLVRVDVLDLLASDVPHEIPLSVDKAVSLAAFEYLQEPEHTKERLDSEMRSEEHRIQRLEHVFSFSWIAKQYFFFNRISLQEARVIRIFDLLLRTWTALLVAHRGC